MQKIYINVYPNTLLVFEYLCNRANIRANRVFVSALFLNAYATLFVNLAAFTYFNTLVILALVNYKYNTLVILPFQEEY